MKIRAYSPGGVFCIEEESTFLLYDAVQHRQKVQVSKSFDRFFVDALIVKWNFLPCHAEVKSFSELSEKYLSGGFECSRQLNGR